MPKSVQFRPEPDFSTPPVVPRSAGFAAGDSSPGAAVDWRKLPERTPVKLRRSQSQSVAVIYSQTGAQGQTAGQIFCKYLIMNGLQNNWRSARSNWVKVGQTDMMSFFEVGAGEGNRTLIASLEGWHSTIELHPRHFPFILMAALALSIHLRIFSPQ